MKKLYRICNPENPIERDEIMLIFRTEARFELSLTTRTKTLKTAYEKFLRAFHEACGDSTIDADLSRDIRQWIEPRPYTKLIERLPHDDKPRRLSFDDDLPVFVGEVKDADGNFVGKWTFEEFGDDDGFFLLFMLQLPDRNADDRLTAAQFSEKTQIPRQTLRRWAVKGKASRHTTWRNKFGKRLTFANHCAKNLHLPTINKLSFSRRLTTKAN